MNPYPISRSPKFSQSPNIHLHPKPPLYTNERRIITRHSEQKRRKIRTQASWYFLWSRKQLVSLISQPEFIRTSMRPCGHWIEGTKGTSSRKVATKHLRHEAKVSTFGFFSPRDITFYFSLNLSVRAHTRGRTMRRVDVLVHVYRSRFIGPDSG